jgi:hypothetical protein
LALDLESQVHLHRGEFELAMDSTELGLTLAESMCYRPLLWRLRERRIRAYLGLGRNDLAGSEREKATEIIDEMAASISDEGLRNRFLNSPAIAKIRVSEGQPG